MEIAYFIVIVIAVFFLCRAANSSSNRSTAELEKFAAEGKSASLKLLREVAFDAIAYAAEETAKAKKDGTIYRSETKLQLAIDYIRRNLKDVSPQLASDMIESVLAKIRKEGATKDEAIR